jgi:glycosyltransferase involved in cell wall biosynthesis
MTAPTPIPRSAPTPALGETVTHDDVTVLVPTLGRPQLRECLESIREAVDRVSGLLVVDQGSGKDGAGWIEVLVRAGVDARHLKQEQRGIGRAMNRGLAHVETPFVAELVALTPRLVRGIVQRDADRLTRSRLVFTDLLPGVWSGFVHPSLPTES